MVLDNVLVPSSTTSDKLTNMFRRLTTENSKLQYKVNVEFWNRVKFVLNGIAQRFSGQESLFEWIDEESYEATKVSGGGKKDDDEVSKCHKEQNPKSSGDNSDELALAYSKFSLYMLYFPFFS